VELLVAFKKVKMVDECPKIVVPDALPELLRVFAKEVRPEDVLLIHFLGDQSKPWY
jgi:hypothetical protein